VANGAINVDPYRFGVNNSQRDYFHYKTVTAIAKISVTVLSNHYFGQPSMDGPFCYLNNSMYTERVNGYL
jgi:hypothetical protein